MVFNRHCLWRLNPAGTSALLGWTKRSYGRVLSNQADYPKQAQACFVLWAWRHWRSVSNASRVADADA